MGYMGILLEIDPKPYSIYLRGTISPKSDGQEIYEMKYGLRFLGYCADVRTGELGCQG